MAPFWNLKIYFSPPSELKEFESGKAKKLNVLCSFTDKISGGYIASKTLPWSMSNFTTARAVIQLTEAFFFESSSITLFSLQYIRYRGLINVVTGRLTC